MPPSLLPGLSRLSSSGDIRKSMRRGRGFFFGLARHAACGSGAFLVGALLIGVGLQTWRAACLLCEINKPLREHAEVQNQDRSYTQCDSKGRRQSNGLRFGFAFDVHRANKTDV